VLADAPFEVQAAQAIDNVLAIVAAGGCTPRQLVRVTAYVVGIEHWPVFDAVYAARLGDVRPARAVVPVPELHHGVLVEVEAIALLPGSGASE
jgi:enamine deaminase RidA (YjgF/YER057c/UK114 family)